MKRFILTLIISLGMTLATFGQSIQLSQETLDNWIQALQRASLLLQASQETMTDLRNSLGQALLIQANLENSLQIAEAKQKDLEDSLTASQDTLQQSQQTIDKLKTLLATSSSLCKDLQDKIDLQNKDIDKVAKDVKSLENENTLLKWGLIGTGVIAAGSIIYALAK